MREEDKVPVLVVGAHGHGGHVDDVAEGVDGLALPLADGAGEDLQLELLLPPQLGAFRLEMKNTKVFKVSIAMRSYMAVQCCSQMTKVFALSFSHICSLPKDFGFS